MPLPKSRTLAFAAMVVSIAGCDVSTEQEQALGADVARQVEEQVPILADPLIARYVDSLGQSIASRAEKTDIDWTFKVVNAGEVNAFALPGGYIYVNRGLLARAGDMSELAGVLGHEIGHVTERHSVEQVQRQQRTGIGVTILCILTDVCSSDVARVAINVGGQLVFAKFSRAQEAEADSVGVRHVIQAGIDPTGIPRMFERLMEERRRDPTVVDAWFGTHPLEQSRVQATSDQIARIDPRALRGLRRSDPGFSAVQAQLRALPEPPKVAPPSP